MQQNMLQKVQFRKLKKEPFDLIGNKIADKIASVSKSLKKLHSVKMQSKALHSQNEKRQQVFDELRLV